MLLLLACSDPPPTATPAATAVPAPAGPDPAGHDPAGHDHAGHDHAGHDHDPGAHGHGARHGGVQAELDGLHLEGVFAPTGILFYPADKDNQPLPTDRFTGTALVKGPSGTTEAALTPMGDHLHALVALELGKPATAIVTLKRDGKIWSTVYEVPAVGLALHDHRSLHGGQVAMWKDVHVELARGAELQFWVTDAKRVPILTGVQGRAKVGGVEVPLTFDAAAGRLYGPNPGEGSVTLEATVAGESFTLGF